MDQNQSPYSESQYTELKKYVGQSLISAAEQYDKAILALSGGALGVSIAFLKDIAPSYKEDTQYWLFVAWIAFVLSICPSLTSFLFSMYAIRHFEKYIDSQQQNTLLDVNTNEFKPFLHFQTKRLT